MTEIQRLMAHMWTDVLQRSTEVGLDENFFEAGGDSLAMLMVLFRVKEELGIELSPAAVIEAPTLRLFCRSIEAGGRASKGAECVLEHGLIGEETVEPS